MFTKPLRIACILLVISLILNLMLVFQYLNKDKVLNAQQTKYSFLAKRIFLENFNDIFINFLDLRNDLHSKVDPWGTDFAMYFEYLPTGTNININSTNEYYVASLFKLPVVMAYFRHKENNKIVREMKTKLRPDEIDPRFGELWKKGVGYEISLDEAARIALQDSDNTATKALGPYIDQRDFDDVYKGIDIELKIASEGALLSPKSYSSILKSLYFSAVLNKDDSQRILEYLSVTKFKDKLIAGIPEGVRVAHKIGIIDNQSYMDCGIVYVPQRPYVLCMISKGSEDTARSRMKLVSKTVYDYVSSKSN